MLTYATMASGVDAPALAWNPMGWRQLWSSEVAKFPSAVLAHHYPDVPNLGDMNYIHERKEYSRPDVLMAGTPCQSFSIAGLRKGLADPRGNLSLVFLGHVDRLRPTWVVWENVPGVLSSWTDEGGDWETNNFDTFTRAFQELGYSLAYRILDAQYFGVAQRRRRVFVVGYLGDWRPAAAVLFERESLSGHPAPSRTQGQEVAGTLGGGSVERGFPIDLDRSGAFIPDLGATLSGSDGGKNEMNRPGALVAYGGNRTSGPIDVAPAVNTNERYDFESEAMIVGPLQAGQDGHGHAMTTQQAAESGHLVAFDRARGHAGVDALEITPPLRAMSGAEGRPNGGGMPGVAYGATVRRLTPVECERLMDMPDNYTRIPWRGKPAEQCPDGPRYRAIGNSIAVTVLEWLGKRIEMVMEVMRAAA